ncbi:MAG: prepilin peptidase [Epsilonproteobacteria bacterium]|nr:prepilin peptidase [Campylobacterota bacterium]
MIGLSIFIFGIIIGSFLNVVIYRVPLEQNIAIPASHCPKCKTPLKWWHNIPILSFVFLRGKCAFCQTKIPSRYPLIELITGILFVMLYYKIGLTWYLPFIFFSFASLFALSVIDFDHMAVPDSVNFAALFFAIINPMFFDSIINGAIAAFGLFAISWISSKIAKKETMGEADVIVAATMGALLGFPLFFIAIFLSALLALIPSLIYKDRGVPFIPFLALATLIVYLFDFYAYNIIEMIMHG